MYDNSYFYYVPGNSQDSENCIIPNPTNDRWFDTRFTGVSVPLETIEKWLLYLSTCPSDLFKDSAEVHQGITCQFRITHGEVSLETCAILTTRNVPDVPLAEYGAVVKYLKSGGKDPIPGFARPWAVTDWCLHMAACYEDVKQLVLLPYEKDFLNRLINSGDVYDMIDACVKNFINPIE